MLLAVDIGNTSTKFGIYDGEELLSRFSLPTDRIPDHASLKELPPWPELPVNKAILCSVVPDVYEELLRLLRLEDIPSVQVTSETDFGLEIRYEPLASIGTDRLVNAFAATEKYGYPIIVCSFGTATTIDLIDGNRIFLGGMIAPGMATGARALKLATSQLPEISIEFPLQLIGSDTVSSIRSGIVIGHAAMVEGLVSRLIATVHEKARVIATGGFAALIDQTSTVIDEVDDDLTLDGLCLLEKRLN